MGNAVRYTEAAWYLSEELCAEITVLQEKSVRKVALDKNVFRTTIKKPIGKKIETLISFCKLYRSVVDNEDHYPNLCMLCSVYDSRHLIEALLPYLKLVNPNDSVIKDKVIEIRQKKSEVKEKQQNTTAVLLPGTPNENITATTKLASQHGKPADNLPPISHEIIGQQPLLNDVAKDLKTNHHMIVLWGSGGLGKTELTTELGRRFKNEFSDGCWIIKLGNLVTGADTDSVGEEIRAVLNVTDYPSQLVGKPVDILHEYLKGRSTLLILDNCEHVIEACQIITDQLLPACPSLRILASSRRHMMTTNFRVNREVQPLSLPPRHVVITNLDELYKYDATALFVERVGRATIHDSDTADIISVCRQWDGIPFCILNAASLVGPMPLSELLSSAELILERESGFGELDHQRTQKMSVEWSYSLLPPQEQDLLLRVAIFPSAVLT